MFSAHLNSEIVLKVQQLGGRVSKQHFVFVCASLCMYTVCFCYACFLKNKKKTFPRGFPLLARSAFILYLHLLVLYALHILLQLCLKVIRKGKKQGVSEVDSGRSAGIHYYGFLCSILAYIFSLEIMLETWKKFNMNQKLTGSEELKGFNSCFC